MLLIRSYAATQDDVSQAGYLREPYLTTERVLGSVTAQTHIQMKVCVSTNHSTFCTGMEGNQGLGLYKS